MISDGVVAEVTFKYLQHTQAANNCAIMHIFTEGAYCRYLPVRVSSTTPLDQFEERTS